MLAVQNPTMGSSRPSDLDMPFGYSFDSASNFPLPSPTAPAPGPSLLDDTEAKYLENFFEGVSNEHFNYDAMFMNGPNGAEMGFGWEDLPPAFMGTTSSYGQQPMAGNHGLHEQPFGGMNTQINAPPLIPPSTPADVLEAATLLQNGSAGGAQSMTEGALFGSHNLQQPYANGAHRSQSMSQYPTATQTHGLPQRAAGEEFFRHSYYKDMVFGGDPAEGTRRRQGLAKSIEIQWGSDTRFASPQGFASTENQRIAEAERTRMNMLDSVFRLDVSNINSSAENTQPSSPAHTRNKSNHTNGDDDDSRSRKRRKGKSHADQEDDDEDDEEDDFRPSASAKSATKKRKPTKKAASTNNSPNPDSSETSHKRRKSAAASASASKAARENLTEEQKRENHIKSEQKRRALIKDGFDDLHELVPNLKGGGFSKSAVLIMAADWLEALLKGNDELRRRLDEMEGRS